MLNGIRAALLPETQRRTLDDLTADLDLTTGDTRSKLSAYWTLLSLSAVIAIAGVLADSTATVIGAMIIAPLSTPIMGIALGLVKGERLGGVRYLLLGSALVVLVGALFSLVLPGAYDLISNSQITGRTSPGLIDLIAAIATGLAGAIALSRRDVAAVLPGVAISISLVPPLGVAGVCLGRGAVALALGALVLFLSNMLALVFAGMFVFTALGYTQQALSERTSKRPRRRAHVTLGAMVVLVLLPLVGNTVASVLVGSWKDGANRAATRWLAVTPGAEVNSVDVQSLSIVIRVTTPSGAPPTSALLAELATEISLPLEVVVEETVGKRVVAGTIPTS